MNNTQIADKSMEGIMRFVFLRKLQRRLFAHSKRGILTLNNDEVERNKLKFVATESRAVLSVQVN